MNWRRLNVDFHALLNSNESSSSAAAGPSSAAIDNIVGFNLPSTVFQKCFYAFAAQLKCFRRKLEKKEFKNI